MRKDRPEAGRILDTSNATSSLKMWVVISPKRVQEILDMHLRPLGRYELFFGRHPFAISGIDKGAGYGEAER